MIGDPDLSVGSPSDRTHEMELRLVEFLRISDEPLPNIAADRIEQLEAEVEQLRDKQWRSWPDDVPPDEIEVRGLLKQGGDGFVPTHWRPKVV